MVERRRGLAVAVAVLGVFASVVSNASAEPFGSHAEVEITSALGGGTGQPLVYGQEGDFWTSTYSPASIVRITQSGEGTSYPLGTAPSGGEILGSPGLSVGPEGDIWASDLTSEPIKHGSLISTYLDRIEPLTGALTAFPVSVGVKGKEAIPVGRIVAVGPSSVWFAYGGGAGSPQTGIGHWLGPGNVKLYKLSKDTTLFNSQLVVDESGDACIGAYHKVAQIDCVTPAGKATKWTPIPKDSWGYISLAEKAPGDARVLWAHCSDIESDAEPCSRREPAEEFDVQQRVATLNSADQITQDFAITEPKYALVAETVDANGDVWGFTGALRGGGFEEDVFRIAPGAFEVPIPWHESQMVAGPKGDIWQINSGGNDNCAHAYTETYTVRCLNGLGDEP